MASKERAPTGAEGRDTLCVQCGPRVRVDEDGCCMTCGALAVGPFAAERTPTGAEGPRERIAEIIATYAVAFAQWDRRADAAEIYGPDHHAAADRILALLAASDCDWWKASSKRWWRATMAADERAEAAEGELGEIAAALPGHRYMDPPDGGDVSLAEQVRRMAEDAEAAEGERDRYRAALEQIAALPLFAWSMADGRKIARAALGKAPQTSDRGSER